MTRQRKYDKEEHARLGKEWYERIRPAVEVGNRGKFVAIDVDTGEYAVADSPEAAYQGLLERVPDALMWFERIGYPAACNLGGRSLGIRV